MSTSEGIKSPFELQSIPSWSLSAIEEESNIQSNGCTQCPYSKRGEEGISRCLRDGGVNMGGDIEDLVKATPLRKVTPSKVTFLIRVQRALNQDGVDPA